MGYLVINEFGPETSQGSLVRIRRQDGVVVPCLIDVLNNHKGLCKGFLTVNKDWNLLVNWVVFQKQFTLVAQIFFQKFVFNALEFESNLHPTHKRASHNSQKLHLFLIGSHCL
ncbi:hypothetical protein V8G54_021236 [Vigna mungo]|uniref:Uncharacterized protein n=1 Tax=Vigna mungo TaxID=3915 RepID=A0AAQ3ND05_VIGMU